MQVFSSIMQLGPEVILPVAILLMGLIFRLRPGEAIRCGIITGIGYIGIQTVITLLTENLGAAAEQMVTRLGLSFTIMDVGWASGSVAAWSSVLSPFLVLVCVLVDVIMLAAGLTKTLFIDIWNYWHIMFLGVTVYIISDSVPLAAVSTALVEAAVLVTADHTAPLVENYFGMKGISLPTASAMMWVPLGFVTDHLLDRISILKEISIDEAWIRKYLGILGEPALLGTLLGCGIGALAGYDPGGIWKLGIYMGAVIFLLPKMVEILIQGVEPVSEAAQKIMQKRFKGRTFYISLDAGAAIGNSAVISTALLLVPILIILAAVLPGNQCLPFADLASIPYFVVFITAHNHGNILKSVLCGTVMLALTLWMTTDFAPIYTQVMTEVGYAMPEGMSQMSSLTCGGNFFNWAALRLAELFA